MKCAKYDENEKEQFILVTTFYGTDAFSTDRSSIFMFADLCYDFFVLESCRLDSSKRTTEH